jgi:hypothetical protein
MQSLLKRIESHLKELQQSLSEARDAIIDSRLHNVVSPYTMTTVPNSSCQILTRSCVEGTAIWLYQYWDLLTPRRTDHIRSNIGYDLPMDARGCYERKTMT